MRTRAQRRDPGPELLPIREADGWFDGGAGEAAPSITTLVLERSGVGLPSWLEIDPRPEQIGTEYTVRRVIEADLRRTLAALADLHRHLVGAPATHVGDRALVRRGPAALLFGFGIATGGVDGNPVSLPASLPVRRWGPPESVQLVVEPWSPLRTEVRLELIRRHGRLRIPRHYFDMAHPAMSALRDELELRAGAELLHPATRRGG